MGVARYRRSVIGSSRREFFSSLLFLLYFYLFYFVLFLLLILLQWTCYKRKRGKWNETWWTTT